MGRAPDHDILLESWRSRVEGRHVFHGTSADALRFPLDPSHNPFRPILPELYRLIDVLESLLRKGFEFALREEHFGRVCVHSLSDILAWTRHDLDNPGIDFTSKYSDAREYADCFQGSQLKENFKYITDHLPERRDDPIVRSGMTDQDWDLVSHVSAWLSHGGTEHRRVVLHVERTCAAFDPDPRCLPAGTFESFRAKVVRALAEAGLPCIKDAIAQVLPSELDGFVVRMYRPLSENCVARIGEGDATWTSSAS